MNGSQKYVNVSHSPTSSPGTSSPKGASTQPMKPSSPSIERQANALTR